MQYESAKLKQEASAALQTLVGGVVLALVPLGVAGSIYKAISPNGWVSQAFGQSISAGTPLLGTRAIVLEMVWFSRVYSSPRRRNPHAGLVVYFFSAAGSTPAAQVLS